MRWLVRFVALFAATLVGCGGSTTAGTGQTLGNAGSGGTDAAEPTMGGGATGGRSGGASGAAGAPSAPAPDGGVNCPIRKTGTLLTEADCYACIDPRCAPPIPIQGVTPTPLLQACLSFANLNTTLYCMYFADGDPFDQPWGAVVGPCKTTGGNVYCGGGL